METRTLKAESRPVVGTRAARALRATGQVPVVIYGHGEPPESVSLTLHEVELALAHGARTLQVKLGRQAKQYLIKEVQYDYLGQTPIHMDLTRVDLDERVKVRVGIELRGVPKGVSEGGVLDQHMADLEVDCMVTDIPETLHPFVVDLGLDESLLVKDLELPSGVVALADPDDRVATVRALLEAPEPEAVEEVEETAAETAQPEVIGRAKKEGEKEAGDKES
jgi:large subunit ribosomal protein L25